MKCPWCERSVTQDEIDSAADVFFDGDNHLGFCRLCAEEVWQKRQQDQTMNNPPQDEGDI